MPEAIVGVASNIDPERNIPAALELLEQELGIDARAPVYHTAPIDRPEQGTYWNTAVRVAADSLDGLRELLRGVETTLGRARTDDRYAARTIDLDVLVWDGQVVDEDVSRRWFLQRLLDDLRPGPPAP